MRQLQTRAMFNFGYKYFIWRIFPVFVFTCGYTQQCPYTNQNAGGCSLMHCFIGYTTITNGQLLGIQDENSCRTTCLDDGTCRAIKWQTTSNSNYCTKYTTWPTKAPASQYNLYIKVCPGEAYQDNSIATTDTSITTVPDNPLSTTNDTSDIPSTDTTAAPITSTVQSLSSTSDSIAKRTSTVTSSGHGFTSNDEYDAHTTLVPETDERKIERKVYRKMKVEGSIKHCGGIVYMGYLNDSISENTVYGINERACLRLCWENELCSFCVYGKDRFSNDVCEIRV